MEDNTGDAAPMEPQITSPDEAPPCPILSALYGSTRAAVELLPGTPLAPIIISCWPVKPAKDLLQESWLAAPAEPPADPTAEPKVPPLFDAASQEYQELPQRVSKSLAMMNWNKLTISLKTLEDDLKTIKDNAEKEATLFRIEELRAGLSEAEASLKEFKDTFDQDATSLVPWMKHLFSLADAGLTTFDVNGDFWPYCAITKLFTNDNTSSIYNGAENILGKFKKRYELERGGNKVQVLTKVAPNVFYEGYSPLTTAELVSKISKTLFGDDMSESIDLVQLYWHDFQEVDVIPTLKVLQRMLKADPLAPELEGDAAETIADGRKIKGIGLVDFPAHLLKQVIQTGVPITAVQVSFGIHDTSAADILEFCQEYNIKVFAKDALMGGLVTEKYMDAPCPDIFDTTSDLVCIHSCLDFISHYGGWAKMQQLLKGLKSVADKHEVKMETVALRWQMDQGTFPVATLYWPPAQGKGERPFLNCFHAKLFQKESFLDAEDIPKLAALCNNKPRV